MKRLMEEVAQEKVLTTSLRDALAVYWYCFVYRNVKDLLVLIKHSQDYQELQVVVAFK